MDYNDNDIETSIMSTKGQVIIPARLRKKYGLTKGKKVIFLEEQGFIKVMPPTDLRKLCGSWKDLDMEAITKEIIEDRRLDEEIEKERENALRKKWSL